MSIFGTIEAVSIGQVFTSGTTLITDNITNVTALRYLRVSFETSIANSRYRVRIVNSSGVTKARSGEFIADGNQLNQLNFNHSANWESHNIMTWTLAQNINNDNILALGDRFHIDIITGNMVIRAATTVSGITPMIQLTNQANNMPSSLTFNRLERFHVSSSMITPTETKAVITNPLQGAKFTTQTITVEGTIENRLGGDLTEVRFRHIETGSVRIVPVWVFSVGQISSFSTVQTLLAFNLYEISVGVVRNDTWIELDKKTIEIIPHGKIEIGVPNLPTLPEPPIGGDFVSQLTYTVEIILYWLLYPLRVVGFLMATVGNEIAELLKSTNAFTLIMQSFWRTVPTEIGTIFSIAVPMLVILWVIKR